MSGQMGYMSTTENLWHGCRNFRTLLRWLKPPGVIGILPQIDCSGPRKVVKSVLEGTWLEVLFNLPHDEEMICNLLVNY